MANSILELQNSDQHIKQLAAQRELYSEAKRILGWQMGMTIGVAIVLSLISIFTKGTSIEPWVEKGTAFVSLLVALLDLLLMEPRQKRLVEQAAKIQESFDCEVLSLEWDELKIGNPPEPELIDEKARKHRRTDQGYSKLKDWYSKSVEQVPLSVARLLCQRANAYWDAGLRRRYATALSWIIPCLCLTLILFGLWRGLTLTDFIFKILIPFQPAFLWCIREYRKQKDAATNLDRLRELNLELWANALKGELAEHQLQTASRSLQNEIYDHRRTTSLVFDWVYKWFKVKDEELMNISTENLVSQYLSKKGIK